MSSSPKIDDTLREAIILQPNVILDDKDLMQALIAANEQAMAAILSTCEALLWIASKAALIDLKTHTVR